MRMIGWHVSLDAFHSFAVQLDPLKTAPPAATFELLRPRAPQTLTLTPEAPPGWLMTISAASSDLDNLRLHTLPAGQPVHAAYSLSTLLVTGKCVDRSGAKGAVGGAKGGGVGSGDGKKAVHGKKGEPRRR